MSYPSNLASDVVLRDGSTVSLRPVRPDDGLLLLGFFASLDERSLAFRFFTGAPNLVTVARVLAEVDQRRRFGLLAMRGPDRRVLGHGFLAAIDDERAEVAFAVSKELQGHGLGSILLAQLTERALEQGFSTLVADVLPGNHRMISMFRDSGLPVEVHSEPDSVIVEMPVSATPESIARFQERDSIAARAAVAALFDTASVAALDGPPAATRERLRGLAAGGVRAMVVRGGPGAWGEPGSAAEHELLEICRREGMRLVGPGSLGIFDNRPGRELDLTAVEELPPPGSVGIVAQGAAAGRRLLEAATGRGLGISTFVSLGDRTDVSANDLLEYWEEDPATGVAVLQVESFSDPRRFARIARRVAARMPIVVLSEGTAAEPPGRGLFDQVGAVHAATPGEALDLADALSRRRARRPPPDRVPSPAATVADARPDEAAAILAASLTEAEAELDRDPCLRLLGCYGLRVDEAAGRSPGASLRLAIDADPRFGPVLRCGPTAEEAAARPARVCPLDEDDAAELLADPPLAAIGARASAGARHSLERTLEAAAALAAAHAEIAAIELDPLRVAPGIAIGGARVRVRRPPERRPWPRTWA